MNIAYVCADLGIPVLGNKGASVHVREFTNALVDLGHTVQIVSGTGAVRHGAAAPGAHNATRARLIAMAPSAATRDTARRVATSVLNTGWQRDPAHLTSELEHLLADSEFTERVLPLLRDFQPDLLIARHAIFSVAGARLAHALGCPYVLEVNAPILEERRRYWGLTLDQLAETADRTAFADVDVLVAVSEGVRDDVLRKGAPNDRVVVVPNGVDLARFRPSVDGAAVRHRYGLDGRVVVGFAGSLKPWHGVDLLLRAFATARALLPRTVADDPAAALLHLLIIGDGPQRSQLAALSEELGLTAVVTFTGTLPHDEIPGHLAAVDIAVAPYVSSNGFYFSPLKVMEYLAMGRAIVASALGQIPSLIEGPDGACGLLYEPDCSSELATAILRLARDAELRQTLGKRAAALARQRYSWETVARRILDRVPPWDYGDNARPHGDGVEQRA